MARPRKKASTKGRGTKAKGRGTQAKSARTPKPRDYKKEYARRLARAEEIAKAAGRKVSRDAARGHPRRERGELGISELRQLRRAVGILSPADQRREGYGRPKTSFARRDARERIAEIAGVDAAILRSPKRDADAKRFAETFVALGLGTMHQAYHLYFSP